MFKVELESGPPILLFRYETIQEMGSEIYIRPLSTQQLRPRWKRIRHSYSPALFYVSQWLLVMAGVVLLEERRADSFLPKLQERVVPRYRRGWSEWRGGGHGPRLQQPKKGMCSLGPQPQLSHSQTYLSLKPGTLYITFIFSITCWLQKCESNEKILKEL